MGLQSCHGRCLPHSLPCYGKCPEGTCLKDGNCRDVRVISDIIRKSFERLSINATSQMVWSCNGKCVQADEPCKDKCLPGRCLKDSKCIEIGGAFIDCNGICQNHKQKCQGLCSKTFGPIVIDLATAAKSYIQFINETGHDCFLQPYVEVTKCSHERKAWYMEDVYPGEGCSPTEHHGKGVCQAEYKSSYICACAGDCARLTRTTPMVSNSALQVSTLETRRGGQGQVFKAIHGQCQWQGLCLCPKTKLVCQPVAWGGENRGIVCPGRNDRCDARKLLFYPGDIDPADFNTTLT